MSYVHTLMLTAALATGSSEPCREDSCWTELPANAEVHEYCLLLNPGTDNPTIRDTLLEIDPDLRGSQGKPETSDSWPTKYDPPVPLSRLPGLVYSGSKCRSLDLIVAGDELRISTNNGVLSLHFKHKGNWLDPIPLVPGDFSTTPEFTCGRAKAVQKFPVWYEGVDHKNQVQYFVYMVRFEDSQKPIQRYRLEAFKLTEKDPACLAERPRLGYNVLRAPECPVGLTHENSIGAGNEPR